METPLMNRLKQTRPLMSNMLNLLSVPLARLKTRSNGAFEAGAPELWNVLPALLRPVGSKVSLKELLKKYQFNQALL